MNDLFRAIFGIPSNDQPGQRMGDRLPQDNRNNYWGNLGDDENGDDDGDEDNGITMRRSPGGGFFGFPLFSDPAEIHKHFDRLVDEMNRAFGVFGFSNSPGITWESESSNGPSFFREPHQRQESLRDAYLKKPDCACDKISQRDDFNSGSNVQHFEPAMSNNAVQFSYPKIYSKSVFIQTVRRPDGSVETIRKVRDHEGNEETTISQSNVNEPLPPPTPPQGEPLLAPKEDTSGLSIFKKFFSF